MRIIKFPTRLAQKLISAGRGLSDIRTRMKLPFEEDIGGKFIDLLLKFYNRETSQLVNSIVLK